MPHHIEQINMEIKTRRLVLTGVVGSLIPLAGCSSGGDSDDEPQREELVSGTFDINEDEFRGWRFSLDQDATLEYSYTVTEGPSIDVFLLDDRAYSHFKEEDNFQYISEGSALDAVSKSVEVDLPEGDEYVLVIDNTNAGEAAPPTDLEDNVARVEIEAYLSPI